MGRKGKLIYFSPPESRLRPVRGGKLGKGFRDLADYTVGLLSLLGEQGREKEGEKVRSRRTLEKKGEVGKKKHRRPCFSCFSEGKGPAPTQVGGGGEKPEFVGRKRNEVFVLRREKRRKV